MLATNDLNWGLGMSFNTPRCVTAGIVLMVCGAAFAHSGATGIVKERMDMMSAIGDEMKLIGNMLRGKASYDAAAVQSAALAISDHAAEITAVFPPGSLQHPTEALPAIWDNWDEFVELSEKMKMDANALAEVAATGDSGAQISEQFKRLGQACSACHEKFRVKK